MTTTPDAPDSLVKYLKWKLRRDEDLRDEVANAVCMGELGVLLGREEFVRDQQGVDPRGDDA